MDTIEHVQDVEVIAEESLPTPVAPRQVPTVYAPTNYVPEVVLSPEGAKAHRERLDEIKRAVMRPEKDYGIIPGCDKPSLYQPGAETLLQMFGFGVRMQIIERFRVEHVGGPDYGMGWGVIARATVTKTINGQQVIIAECEAYCGHDESKWGKRKGKNRSTGQEYEIEGAPLHTLMTMAQKRAKVYGARTATGASELFTQDIEDLTPEELAARPSTSGGSGKEGFLWPLGQDKGKPLAEVSERSLKWFIEQYETRDAKWKAQDDQRKQWAREELKRRKAPQQAASEPATPAEDLASPEQRDDLKKRIGALPEASRAAISEECKRLGYVFLQLTKPQLAEIVSWVESYEADVA